MKVPGLEKGSKQIFTESVNSATIAARIGSKDGQIVTKNYNRNKLESGADSRLGILARGLIGKNFMLNNLHAIRSK